MSQYPTQVRSVDPFATYNSDTVNKLTRTVSHGNDALEQYNTLRGSLDATVTTIVNLLPGIVYKDDVRLEVSAFTVDFEDPNQYENFGPGFNEAGYYYILLEYLYQKSRPAPQCKIVILKPSQLGAYAFNSNWVFIHAARVIFNGFTFEVAEILDYNPTVLEDKRLYIPVFSGSETQLPSFDENNDRTRIVYDASNDKFWFGHRDRWAEAGGAGTLLEGIDTSLVSVGEICRIDTTTGQAVATLADDLSHQADIVVNVSSATGGQGIIAGAVTGVPVETGVLIAVGDIVYLSKTEPGKVTNIRTSPIYQIVGRATANGSSVFPLAMIFSPKIMLATAFEGTISTWTLSGGSPPYYADIDISALDSTGAVLCNFFNAVTTEQVVPPKVQYFVVDLRVFSNNNTDVINYIISAGGGESGEGGGGVTVLSNHALLTNLSYAASGHTGFSQNPHGNGDHTSTFITAASVIFATLNANGSVGIGAGQVSQGNHTHAEFANINFIPSGSKLLFHSDTAIVGWTLITTIDDAVVYVTKGSGAGGETGGAFKSGGTWTQPVHNHAVSTHQHDLSSHTHTFTASVHTHRWLVQGSPDVNGSRANTYAADGVTIVHMGTPNLAASNFGLIVGGYQYNGYQQITDGYTENATGAGGTTAGPNTNLSGVGGPSTTGTANTTNTWRPVGTNMTLQQRI